jgi:hypothetical protein
VVPSCSKDTGALIYFNVLYWQEEHLKYSVPSSVPVVASVDTHTHRGGGREGGGGRCKLQLPAGAGGDQDLESAGRTGSVGEGGERGGALDDDAPSRPHRALGCAG